MDGSRFDAWTRRRLSLTLGGAFASLLGLAAVGEGEARRRRRRRDRDRNEKDDKDKKRRRKNRKKRCIKLSKSCIQGHSPECCGSYLCRNFGNPTNFRCCLDAGRSCSSNRDNQCCPGTICRNGFCANVNE